MAIYHLSVKSITTDSTMTPCGHSAYISASVVKDDLTGITHDYRRKADVLHREIMLPSNAPSDFADREKLWNSAEKFEASKHKNTEVAKSLDVALPKEFSLNQAIDAAHQLGAAFVADGMCFEFAIHWEKDNPHIDGMMTSRLLEEDGSWKATKEKKVYANTCTEVEGKMVYGYDPTIPNDTEHRFPVIDKETGEQKVDSHNRKQWQRTTIEATPWAHGVEWLTEKRALWADICNEKLEVMGVERIDHRTLEAQGIDREATIHEGYAARKIEAEGGISDKCEINREIVARNTLREKIEAKIEDFKSEIEGAWKDVVDGIKGVGEKLEGLFRKFGNSGADLAVAGAGVEATGYPGIEADKDYGGEQKAERSEFRLVESEQAIEESCDRIRECTERYSIEYGVSLRTDDRAAGTVRVAKQEVNRAEQEIDETEYAIGRIDLLKDKPIDISFFRNDELEEASACITFADNTEKVFVFELKENCLGEQEQYIIMQKGDPAWAHTEMAGREVRPEYSTAMIKRLPSEWIDIAFEHEFGVIVKEDSVKDRILAEAHEKYESQFEVGDRDDTEHYNRDDLDRYHHRDDFERDEPDLDDDWGPDF